MQPDPKPGVRRKMTTNALAHSLHWVLLAKLMFAPTCALELPVRLAEGLPMRHKPLLNRYSAGLIGLGLLPIAMAIAAAFIP
jgi:hypothetical protein